MPDLLQYPQPGTHLILYQGDLCQFRFDPHTPGDGQAWLRTNLGHGKQRIEEILAHYQDREAFLHHDWQDIPMTRLPDGTFALTLPMLQVGRFEAKACFLPSGTTEPIWPAGDNVVIKIEPAEYCCANTIYTAFVRQFGSTADSMLTDEHRRAIGTLDGLDFAVIPQSGTFRKLLGRLDFIVNTLGFRIIQLLPIHPVPTTYARMGRFGSPFAALDFMAVDPALADFDRTTTPLDQFKELLDAVHCRGARLFMDVPANHTGWASSLQVHASDWFVKDGDKTFRSPGAWGVTWKDLSQLDYSHRGLWHYMADVFLYWCGQGVDGFRCDAGYMIPTEVWTYIVASVREQYPDTIFMLEGLGGSIAATEDLLDRGNLDWAYSEIFQNHSRSQIEGYFPGSLNTSDKYGLLVSFAETHDNQRLAATSPAFARLRTALVAMCSLNGAFGITAGVEWFARDKIDVHGSPPLNWDGEPNQVKLVARLNAIVTDHPCFHPGAKLRLLPGEGSSVVLIREAPPAHVLLVVANVDHEKPVSASWDRDEFDSSAGIFRDLISGREVPVSQHAEKNSCPLTPGEVLCLTLESAEDKTPATSTPRPPLSPARLRQQRIQAKALEVLYALRGSTDFSGLDPKTTAAALECDPRRFLGEAVTQSYVPLVTWHWPSDLKREVMVPASHFLLIEMPYEFSLEIDDGDRVFRCERSLTRTDGEHFALLTPLSPEEVRSTCSLRLTVFEPEGVRHTESHLVLLRPAGSTHARVDFSPGEIVERDICALCTNGRGAMAHVRGAWGEIHTQYDALLAANLDDLVPVDRRIMLTRCRCWINFRGYSKEIALDCQRVFSVRDPDRPQWRFEVPSGLGNTVPLEIELELLDQRNAVRLQITRLPAHRQIHMPDTDAVKIIIRPDIEDRDYHHKTKAYLGLDRTWPAAVQHEADGFTFTPGGDRHLYVGMDGSDFVPEPEWQYMVSHPVEAQRGLDDSSDLFSPGYFSATLKGGATVDLRAVAWRGEAERPNIHAFQLSSGSERPADVTLSIETAMRKAIGDYIVKRDDSLTVIAGYPWFLDWGRDTLICLRGAIAAGLIEESRQILLQFARFERQGTLPNMIRGNDDSNRDTSDAPLWFFRACADLVEAMGSTAFLDEDCGKRSVRDVLISIARSYEAGTPNGIRMDSESALIFSPSHFTWMDTNHPAGTPRAGYPVEIQALWYSALNVLAGIDAGTDWRDRAGQVREALMRYFVQPKPGYLSDCLHAAPGEGAAAARADDALRPNQLFAITLGAVTDSALQRQILSACSELLVPGGIRSLADRSVEYPLPISHNSQLLNDPNHPYQGHYGGDEDTSRKPAYHNGTAWTWPFPSYCEALFMSYGPSARDTALAILSSSERIIDRGCARQVPEILDGDAPHHARGCTAQAWGVTELYRVLAILDRTQ